MSRAGPIRQFSPFAALAHFGLLFAVLLGASRLAGPDQRPLALVLAVALFFAASIVLRMVLTPDHERALRLVRRQRFAEAAAAFERSYDRLARRPWIDRWRWLVLLSPSRVGLRELALCNASLCRARIGDMPGARQAAQRAVATFPSSALAQSSLTFLDELGSPAPAGPASAPPDP